MPAITNQPLLLDLLTWLGPGPRPYPEVMDAWRTHCPRFPIWEDALEHGFVACTRPNGADPMVELTRAGQAFLRQHRPTLVAH